MESEEGVAGRFWCRELGLESGRELGANPPNADREWCIAGDIEGAKPETAGLNGEDPLGARGTALRAGN